MLEWVWLVGSGRVMADPIYNTRDYFDHRFGNIELRLHEMESKLDRLDEKLDEHRIEAAKAGGIVAVLVSAIGAVIQHFGRT